MTANSSPSITAYWRTVNPAHAIQRAAIVLSFSEELTSVVIKRIVDALRDHMTRLGLSTEQPVNTVLFKVQPGAEPETVSGTQSGTAFQRVQAGNVIQSLTVTSDTIRFETHSYTRWVAFIEQFAVIAGAALPIVEQVTKVKSLALEYVDFFYGAEPGTPDAMQIIDKASEYISRKAFSRRAPWHSHTGWFEQETASTRRLVNVDLTANDAQGPDGLRRAITIRTYEADQIFDMDHPNAPNLATTEAVIASLESIHVSLKRRLRGILTRDASTMISLGN